MKKSEIEDHIRKFILPAHQGYILDKYILYTTFADGFFIKGYLFYSRGDNEVGLNVTYFVMPLCVKTEQIACVTGEELYYTKRKSFFKKINIVWWDVTKASQAATFKQINTAIDAQGEPFLRKFKTAKDVYNFHGRERKDNIRIYEECTYAAILFGNRRLQDKMLKGLIYEAKHERNVDWVHQIKADAELLLIKQTRDERIAILKTWANETVANLKLARLTFFV